MIFNGENETKLHRDIFAEKMCKFFQEDEDVVYLDADLMEAFGMQKVWREYPNRAFNCGISEANMIGMGAGLSLTGKKVFAHTFGSFAARRCYDQLFISIAYNRADIKLIGSDPGITASFNGGTHMPFEDMALMRAIPKSTVLEMSDGVMFGAVLEEVKDLRGLIYIRTTRKTYKKIYDNQKFKIGGSHLLREGTDLVIYACGMMVGEALEAAEILQNEKNISAGVVDMYSVKPLDTEMIKATAERAKAVITCENHSVYGGLGDAVQSALFSLNILRPCVKIGIHDEFGEVGPVPYLQEKFGLRAADIVKVGAEI